jgi:hypothetical protein
MLSPRRTVDDTAASLGFAGRSSVPTVSPAHAVTETSSQFAGSSRRNRIARSDWVVAGCLSPSRLVTR